MIRSIWRQLVPSLILTGIVAVAVGIVYPLVVYGIGQAAFKNQADGSLISRDGKVVGAANIGQSFTDANGNPLPQYFQSRPSATSPYPYNASSSAASNLGPSDPRLVGFIPGFNTVGLNGQPSKTNPFASAADPYCVPVSAATGDPVINGFSSVKLARSDGTYVCDPNTVPERALAYRQLNDLPVDQPVPVDAVTASSSGLDPGISIENADLQTPRVARARNLPLSTVLVLVKAHTIGAQWGFLGEPYVNVLELNLALDSLKR
ncbi:MAG TPA: potassium-transporting ATPase subunit C [Acidimicrobiales bacterium]|nr:potassium-transporting ATPase subunit C [Acidimicrobiales bacterium]